MPNEAPLYKENTDGEKLFYSFTPASIASNFIPLVIVLDPDVTEFEYKMWNILRPIDEQKNKNHNSQWMGDKGDILQALIADLVEEYECEEHIYVYGTTKGSYGAVFHAVRCKADAVFMDSISKGSDEDQLLKSQGNYPIFYFCKDDELDRGCSEETDTFMKKCEEYAIKSHLIECESLQDEADSKFKKLLDRFEFMNP